MTNTVVFDLTGVEKPLFQLGTENEHVTVSGAPRKYFQIDTAFLDVITEVGAKNWATLCVIVSFMDNDVSCSVSVSKVAETLGVSHQAASRRIARLLEYKWRGQPIITAKRRRKENGQWDTTQYKLLPLTA